MIIFFFELVLAVLLLIILVIDAKKHEIYDLTIYLAGAFALIYNFLKNGFAISSIIDLLISCFFGFLFFWLQYHFSRRKWVGFGDCKLGAVIGLMLGIKGLILTLFLAYVAGAIISLVLVLLGKKTMKSHVPLGAFLSAAAIVTLFWGDYLINWYLSFSQ